MKKKATNYLYTVFVTVRNQLPAQIYMVMVHRQKIKRHPFQLIRSVEKGSNYVAEILRMNLVVSIKIERKVNRLGNKLTEFLIRNS